MEVIIIGFFILCANVLFTGIRFLLAMLLLQEVVVSTNILYMFVAILFPFLWWMYSTKEDAWSFYDRKYATLRLCAINAAMVIAQAVWKAVFDSLVVKICMLPNTYNFDEGVALALSRLILFLAVVAVIALINFAFNKAIESAEMQEAIETFKWQHIVDTRENKDQLYDLKILRNMKTGSDVIIKEVDRFVHMFVLGNSGTGKTSSTLTPAVICDLDHKISNMQKRERAKERLLKAGQARIMRPKDGDALDEFSVRPVVGYEKQMRDVLEKYPDCGITVMAPNQSLLKDVAKLCKARNIKVNLIDPMDSFDDRFVRHLGINPFYVPLDLDPEERQIQIYDKAKSFTEVLLTVSELHGTTEAYFRSVNEAVTTNIAAMCMLRANLYGRQTNIAEIQSCINVFAELRSVIADIERAFHMQINLMDVGGKYTNKSNAVSRESLEEAKNVRPPLVLNTPPLEDEKEIPEHLRLKGMTLKEYEELIRQQAEAYYQPLYFIHSELLGPGAADMFQQARGLRNLLNNLLFEPRTKRLMCAEEGHFIEWDKALAHGEVTLINTALEIGPQSSTALGLFLMLSMKTAVLRRLKNNKTGLCNHFLYIDEAAQYMHPMYDDMFTLYRQYKVACCLAMQSISQMKKTKTTEYLMGVIMGAGIHVVFGRLNADEMRYYEKMGGVDHVQTLQKTVSHNSQFDPNGRITTMERVIPEKKNTLDAHKIRTRDFQEVSVFMIDAGRVLKGFIAKATFPKKKDYQDKNITHIDFAPYASFDVNTLKLNDFEPETLLAEDTKDTLEDYVTGIKNVSLHDLSDSLQTVPSLEDSLKTAPVKEEAKKEEAQEETPAADKPDEDPMIALRNKYMAAVKDDAIFEEIAELSRKTVKAREIEERRKQKEIEAKEAEEEARRLKEEEEKKEKEAPKEEVKDTDFAAFLHDEVKEEPLAKAAGAEDFSAEEDDDYWLQRMKALNADYRRDD